jgi:hypothetical protein
MSEYIIGCYPPKKQDEDDEKDDIIINNNNNINNYDNNINHDDSNTKTIEQHNIFKEGKVNYINKNDWNSYGIKNDIIEKSRNHTIDGVVVRDLPTNHVLSGQQGLFATVKFNRFDIIGEYTGKITGEDKLSGHYLACLESSKDNHVSLGVDSEFNGNEMRFINSYLNIDFSPNVMMKTAYISTYPHVMIIVIREIEVDEEILLDYGSDYNNLFILPHLNKV